MEWLWMNVEFRSLAGCVWTRQILSLELFAQMSKWLLRLG